MKYGIWNVAEPRQEEVNGLVGAGYAPLVSMVLSARGVRNPQQAQAYLRSDSGILDPYLMKDMKPAVQRIRQALKNREKIAVFGDYDVDGITATCLLTDFLRRQGGTCVPYIPGRLEEGYGLNELALRQLQGEGVKLIVTVDCGITAIEEARLCKKLGMDLIITDHHECKTYLPSAVAVVDPHRPDGSYPHKNLCGVGVAFKLASAIYGSQEQILNDYADMVCLGTVADVMPLQGENRVIVARGLQALKNTKRPGLAALMAQCNCDPQTLTATSVGYTLAPRINAAGRMGQIDLAVELFLTEDSGKAKELACALCELNKARQAVEAEIYAQAVSMLPADHLPSAIVLADEQWHQGVVGIVASRIAEEYCCPAFLICLDGEHGKASSRSYGGFNLFASLTQLQGLLESYGGHELAAGFTIHRDQIPAFRAEICRLAQQYYDSDLPRTQLDCDCRIQPELMTVSGIDALEALEPCGNGCPRPLLTMENLTVERITQVGGGKHMRLQLSAGKYLFNGIFFSASAESADIGYTDGVDVAFYPQVNSFRGQRTVQMNIVDIRPHCRANCSFEMDAYRALREDRLEKATAERLFPTREMLALVWRYISGQCGGKEENPLCLCRKIVRWGNKDLSLAQMLTCLDIFADVGLIEVARHTQNLTIRLLPNESKRDLNESATMQRLLRVM